MNDLIDRDGFRANVGIVLMGGNDQLFLGRRSGGRGWQFPQGGMRPGEDSEQSLYRELQEEIGLEPGDVTIIGQTQRWLRYRLPARYVRRGGRPLCVGQKQRWFLLRLAREDASIRFDTTAEPEFDRGRWVDFWQPVREVIYFKRPVYTRALHELGLQAFPGGLPPYPPWWQPRQSSPPAAQPDADHSGAA
jgi:putative (di)nucleoside polyphosphate hydrolase